MRPTDEAHAAKPGPAVVEVAACDDQTALAIQEQLAARRQPGEPGIRLRCFPDLRQEPDSGS
ncbi:DUF6207 family protein [Streptomyces sp. R11]|uniref:DUF6207 family protein n=1 Tax=Streptomyces sp. R11 TaxID=3238625 RepID=A0AB39NCP8_9ACTN